MQETDIVDQVRAARDRYAKSHNYDLAAIVEDLRKKEKEGSEPVVYLPPRRPKPDSQDSSNLAIEKHSETLSAIAVFWAQYPEVHLGQLLTQLGTLAESQGGKGLSQMKDSELIAALNRHREELQGKLQHQTN
ncbi:hypothetical protein BH10PLA2_BH10PLA2_04140 [soil metagenome]